LLQKLKYYLKEIFFTFLIIVVISNFLSYYRSIDINKNNFNIENFNTQDKAFVVHFWATWCPTCKFEAPNIQTLSEEYPVLTIAVNSKQTDIDRFMEKNGYDYQVLNDANSKIASKYNIKVFPTTLIFDKNNKLVFSEVGYTSTLGLKLRIWWANIK
jgi:thiol-disulfide isomerase/thioredoxin